MPQNQTQMNLKEIKQKYVLSGHLHPSYLGTARQGAYTHLERHARQRARPHSQLLLGRHPESQGEALPAGPTELVLWDMGVVKAQEKRNADYSCKY